MIVQADARHFPLKDKCVQTCVTSPPYWGLRDYGTATWDGGDAGCDHKVASDPAKSQASSGLEGAKRNCGNALSGYRDLCGKCGARRIDRQIGLEATPDEYVATMVGVFKEIWRVLRDDGTVWLNLGDSYVHGVPGGGSVFANGRNGSDGRKSYESDKPRGREKLSTLVKGLKVKDLCGIPWRVAFALQADGWYLRSDIVWAKPNPMPESVTDRPTRSHEYIFLLSKNQRYFYDADAIREEHSREWWTETVGPKYMTATDGRNDGGKREGNGNPIGRNKRSVWTVNSEPTPEAHFATFPQKLILPCIRAGSRKGDLVLDPFLGSGTTGLVAQNEQRRWVGFELNKSYINIVRKRTTSIFGGLV